MVSCEGGKVGGFERDVADALLVGVPDFDFTEAVVAKGVDVDDEFGRTPLEFVADATVVKDD